MTQPSAPPGWYPDVDALGHERYWDGTQWTSASRPVAPPPKPASASVRGPFKALGGIATVIIVGVIIASANGSSDSTPSSDTGSTDQQGPMSHPEDVTITSCARDSTTGYPQAAITVTNSSSKASNYTITIAFESSDHATQYDTGLASVTNLQPGQTGTETASSLKAGVPDGFVCVVADATRLSAVG